MNTLLWTLQVLLAIIFAASGLAKISLPKEQLIAIGQTGVALFPEPLIRFTAACELLGALAMLLPRPLAIAPFLTPLAALGFAVIMVAAIIAHARLREPRNVALTTMILIVAVTVAVGTAFSGHL